MHFTVAYHPTALDNLADIWLAAPDPQAVSIASDSIDRLLKLQGDKIGIDLGHLSSIARRTFGSRLQGLAR